MPPLFPLTLAFFAVAVTLCFVTLAQPQPQSPSGLRRDRWVFPLLLLGVLAQAFDIAWLCLHGQHPGSSAREAIYFASWLMLLSLTALTLRPPLRSHLALLGALLLPVALVMDVLVRVVPIGHGGGSERVAGVLVANVEPRLITAHIFSATLGTALFGIAAACGVLYLLSERRLRRRGAGKSGAHGGLPAGALQSSSAEGAAASGPRPLSSWRGPSLETLDSWNQRSIAFGMLAFTAALISGTSWLIRVAAAGGIGQGNLLSVAGYLFGQSRYGLAVMTWLIYAGLLLGRAAFGLRGRRAARLTIVGFLMALGVLFVYFVRDVRSLP
jgi:ABC-type uncharacterized transport system permease subunit